MAISPADWSGLEIDTIEIELGKIYVLPTPPLHNGSEDTWTVYYNATVGGDEFTREIEAESGDQVFVTEVDHPTLGRQYAIHIRTISDGTATETVEYVDTPDEEPATLEFRLTNLYGSWDIVPALSVVSVTSSSVTVSWTYSQHTGNTIYYVQYSTNGTTWNTATQNGTMTNPYAISGLASATLYYVRIRAFNLTSQEYSSYSNIASDTTSASGGGKGGEG